MKRREPFDHKPATPSSFKDFFRLFVSRYFNLGDMTKWGWLRAYFDFQDTIRSWFLIFWGVVLVGLSVFLAFHFYWQISVFFFIFGGVILGLGFYSKANVQKSWRLRREMGNRSTHEIK